MNRARYQRSVLRAGVGLERKLAGYMRKELSRQFRQAAKLIAEGVTRIDPVIDVNASAMITILEKHYKRVGSTYFDLMGKINKSIFPSETKTMEDDFWASFNLWAREQAARKIVAVAKTTKWTIANVIKHGMVDGLSNRVIAEKIQDAAAVIVPRRSLTISRTETHNAATRSMEGAAEVSGIMSTKEWISVEDERTRTAKGKQLFDHVKANDETVKMTDAFQNTGESMRYPGDENGSAGNVINCRCVVLYHTE